MGSNASENLAIAGPFAVQRALLLLEHLAELFALAEHLLVFGSVHHEVDDIAARAFGGPRHQLLKLLLHAGIGTVGGQSLQTIVKSILARRDPRAVAELLAHRAAAAGKHDKQRQRRDEPPFHRSLPDKAGAALMTQTCAGVMAV